MSRDSSSIFINFISKRSNCFISFVVSSKQNLKQYIQDLRNLKEFNPGLESSQIVVDFEKASVHAFQKVFSGDTIKRSFFFCACPLAQSLGYRISTSNSRCMFVKSFVALEIIPELDIDFGVVAVCCEISDKIDELTLFDYDYVDYFESN